MVHSPDFPPPPPAPKTKQKKPLTFQNGFLFPMFPCLHRDWFYGLTWGKVYNEMWICLLMTKFDCPKVPLCGCQDIKIQLLTNHHETFCSVFVFVSFFVLSGFLFVCCLADSFNVTIYVILSVNCNGVLWCESRKMADVHKKHFDVRLFSTAFKHTLW